MKTYTVLVHDRHRRQPLRLAAELAHDQRACEFARERLAASDDHLAIEVWDGDVRLCKLRAQDDAATAQAA